MPQRIDGVSQVMLETWVRRDFGLTSAQLRVALELRDGPCPVYYATPQQRGITPRDIYLARVVTSLPSMAKPRCMARTKELAGTYARYLFPKPNMPEFK